MKKPIVYYAIAIYLGCFSLALFHFSYVISILVAATFFIVIYIHEDVKGFSLISGFFIIGYMSYFQVFKAEDIKGKVKPVR